MLDQAYDSRQPWLSCQANTFNVMTLTQLVDPFHTAVVLQECQNGIIGANSGLPAEYVELAIEHSLAFVSTIAATEEIVAAWS